MELIHIDIVASLSNYRKYTALTLAQAHHKTIHCILTGMYYLQHIQFSISVFKQIYVHL